MAYAISFTALRAVTVALRCRWYEPSKEKLKTHINHAEGVYIINSAGIAYYHGKAVDIIKPQV